MSTLPHPSQVGEASTWPDDAVEVGRILGAWGIQGEIRIKPLSADPQALFSTKRWHLHWMPAAPGVVEPVRRLLKVIRAREHGEGIVAKVEGLDDRDLAQALAGGSLAVSRSSFPTLDDGEYYWVDLIGMDVVNREGVPLGRVEGLIETGPHCVLRLRGADRTDERLIPFVDAYVDAVDRALGRITVDWDPAD